MNLIDQVKLIDFTERGDERGYLVVIESEKDIDFELKRLFYIYGSQSDVVRGQHANKKSEFVLVNVNGSSKVTIKDGLGNSKTYVLDRPNLGLYIPKLLWKDMYDFSEDSVLLVLSSEYYDSNEYIRDYEEYEKLMSEYKEN